MIPRRDFIGYGATPPDPKWPDQARLAINFVINYEEGSEYSVLDGDSFNDTALTELGSYEPGIEGRDLAAESMFEYGTRAGFWRVLRLFQERNLPLTVFGCALALERHPAAAHAIKEANYDVCCHGWRWENHYDLDLEQEREHIHKAIASLELSIGERPYGWYCRYGPSVNTRTLLVEEGGFLYDSDAYNDDLPYWVIHNEKQHLVIPYTLSNNDAKFGLGSFATANDFNEYLRDCFDFLHREGATHPKMMSIGLHLRVIGHPARITGLERFLDYVMTFNDIWVCKRIDIAKHWIATHPASV